LKLGVLGVARILHNAPPVRLSYRGLSEIVVGVCYGPPIAAFLRVNELPDRRADESAGKRTLVTRLGTRRPLYPHENRRFFGRFRI
jgi:1,4-dihydroxy-2-naphthoate octaprenyltransferase